MNNKHTYKISVSGNININRQILILYILPDVQKFIVKSCTCQLFCSY